MINERLLQFIWQFQHFNRSDLQTDTGEHLTIINPGRYNTHQGPDFLEAKVAIDKTILAGNIEIHINSSDWKKHNHESDKNYGNIVLHVVWQNDLKEFDEDHLALPTLTLQNLVPKLLIDRFKDLMRHTAFVPCDTYLPFLDEMKWLAWKERISVERMQRKSAFVIDLLGKANNHWEEVFWWMLARNFGIKVNADIFEAVAKSIQINILAKHKNQIHQLEALLLGQAGLLENNFEEDYPKLLKAEYLFYQKKYRLKQVPVKPFFLRMRPANFPTIRLAQLAMLVHNSAHLFSKIKETNSIDHVKELLNVTANDYWHYHYKLDEAGDYFPKQLGAQMVDNIVINTIVPVLFAYASITKDETIKDKAMRWLGELSPERNTITKRWGDLGVVNSNAMESQALIELKNNYCDLRLCLKCAVGNAILKGGDLKGATQKGF